MTAELLYRSSLGDTEAFLRFYDATCHTAYAWAVRRHRDRERADEAFRALYRRAWVAAAEHADSGVSPVAWLISLGSPRYLQRGPAAVDGTVLAHD